MFSNVWKPLYRPGIGLLVRKCFLLYNSANCSMCIYLMIVLSTDTAVIYRNEEDIGLALEEILPKYQLNRSDLFITSKLCKLINCLHKQCKLLTIDTFSFF